MPTIEYEDIYKKTLLSVLKMEKLMRKKTFAQLLEGLVIRPKRKLTFGKKSNEYK